MRRLFFLFLSLCCLEEVLYAQDQSSLDSQYSDQNQQNLSLFHPQSQKQDNSLSTTHPHHPQDKNLSKQQTKTGESDENIEVEKKTKSFNQEKASSNEKKEKEAKKKKNSPHTLTSSVSFLSDYRSRGISQTFLKPAVQGELKYTHTRGFYFKSWGSNVDGTGNLLNNTSLEWDLFIGFKRSLFQTKVTFDTGLLFYYYPGGQAPVRTNTRYNTLEYYLAFEYKKLELKISVTLTDFFANNSSNPPENWDKLRPSRPNGHSMGSPYLEINYEYPFSSKWKVSAHLGHQGVVNYPQLNYFDWLAGLTRKFEWFEVVLTYVQTNAKKAYYNVPDHSYRPSRFYLGGPTLVIAVNKTF